MKKLLLLLLILPVVIAGVQKQDYPDYRFNVRWSGAQGNGTANDQTAIENAIAKAYAAGGGVVFFPDGVYLHDSVINVPDSVWLVGPGELRSTDTTSTNPQMAVLLAGDKCGLKDLTISTTWSGARQSNNYGCAVLADGASNFTIENTKVYGSATAGILISASSFGRVVGNTVKNTLADGIHTTNVSSGIVISGNQTDSTGDDCIAVVSKVSQGGVCSEITITGNVVKHGSARGIAVVGGDYISISDNTITDMVYSGLYIGSESSITSYGSTNVHGSNNNMDSTGASSPQALASVQIYGRADYPTENVSFEGGSATNCRYIGATVGNPSELVDSTTKNIKIHGMTFIGAGGNDGFGLYAAGGTDLTFSMNSVEHFASYGLAAINGAGSGDIRIVGNTFRDIDTIATGTEDVIGLLSSTYSTAYIFLNSVYDINDSTERFVQINVDSIPTIYYFSNQTGGLPSLPASLGYLPDSLSSADLQNALNDEVGGGAGGYAMFSNQPNFTLLRGNNPTPTTEGDIQWDTSDNMIVIGNGVGQTRFPDTAKIEAMIAASVGGALRTLPYFSFRFAAGITNSDPGNGNIKFNNATPASVTQLFVDDLTMFGESADDGMLILDTGYILTLQPVADLSTDQSVYRVSGVEDSAGWVVVNVVTIGANLLPTATDTLMMQIVTRDVRTGGSGTTDTTFARSPLVAITHTPNDTIGLDSTVRVRMGWIVTDSVKGTQRFTSIGLDTLSPLMKLLPDTAGMGAGGGGHIAFDDSTGARIWLDTLGGGTGSVDSFMVVWSDTGWTSDSTWITPGDNLIIDTTAGSGSVDSFRVVWGTSWTADSTWVTPGDNLNIDTSSVAAGSAVWHRVDSVTIIDTTANNDTALIITKTAGEDTTTISAPSGRALIGAFDQIGSGTTVLSIFAESLYTTKPVYKAANHADSQLVTKGYAQTLSGSGTADSVGVDTGAGTFTRWLYPAYLREGSNITLSITDDTLDIASSDNDTSMVLGNAGGYGSRRLAEWNSATLELSDDSGTTMLQLGPASGDSLTITAYSIILGGDTLTAPLQAHKLHEEVKNTTGSAIAKGVPVYIIGQVGDLPRIAAADAAGAATMPAIGLTETAINNGDSGYVATFGTLAGLNTSAYDSGAAVYVANGGGLTATKPTGTNLIQKVGIVSRVHASQGHILISGAGRTNDIPNIASDNVWVGNASGVPTATGLNAYIDTTSAKIPTASVADSATGALRASQDPAGTRLPLAAPGGDAYVLKVATGPTPDSMYWAALTGSGNFFKLGADTGDGLQSPYLINNDSVVIQGNTQVGITHNNQLVDTLTLRINDSSITGTQIGSTVIGPAHLDEGAAGRATGDVLGYGTGAGDFNWETPTGTGALYRASGIAALIGDSLDEYSLSSALRGPMNWQYSTTVTDGDPTTGIFRLNNATPAAATFIYADDVTRSGLGAADGVVPKLRANDYVWFQKQQTVGTAQLYRITGTPTDGTGYWKIPIEFVDGGATGLVDADTMVFVFITTRDTSDVADRAVGDGSGNAITTTYETITKVGNIGDDTTNFKLAWDSVQAWDNGILVWANGSVPLTANWSAGDFDVTGLEALEADTLTGTVLTILNDFELNVAGTNALYDSTDGASDGDVLTWHTGNTVRWDAQTGGAGEANTISAIGETASNADSLTAGKSGVDLRIKSLVAGTNITLTPTDTTLTIDATGGGSDTAVWLGDASSSPTDTVTWKGDSLHINSSNDTTWVQSADVLIGDFDKIGGGTTVLSLYADSIIAAKEVFLNNKAADSAYATKRYARDAAGDSVATALRLAGGSMNSNADITFSGGGDIYGVDSIQASVIRVDTVRPTATNTGTIGTPSLRYSGVSSRLHTGDTIRPPTTNTGTVGTSALRWEAVRARDAFVDTLRAASRLGVPTAATTAPTSEGVLIYDTGDEWFVTYDGANQVVAANTKRTAQIVMDDPDNLVYDTVMVMYVNADTYPAGITLTGWGFTRTSTTSSTMTLYEMSDLNSVVSTIETITTCTTEACEDDGTLADASIAAGNYICVDYNDVDEATCAVWITFRINDN